MLGLNVETFWAGFCEAFDDAIVGNLIFNMGFETGEAAGVLALTEYCDLFVSNLQAADLALSCVHLRLDYLHHFLRSNVFL